MNIQNLCHYSYRLRQSISGINLQGITEKTLEHGRELPKKELNKIYGLILVYESFLSISLYHDFFEIKSIQRGMEEGVWTKLILEKDLLQNQNILNDDLLLLNDKENSLQELQQILLIVHQETLKYFKVH